MAITRKIFGTLADGTQVECYRLENKNGMAAEILTYGGTLHALYVPDKNGVSEDVLVGFDDLEGHVERSDYQGQLVGRYANRIGGASFTAGGQTYHVTTNEKGKTCLHGGGEFSHGVWLAEPHGVSAVKLTFQSKDGANGFPGDMTAQCVYTLTDDNTLILDYTAWVSQPCPVNLTNHAYFNLSGKPGTDILGHVLKINADCFTPTDSDSIPTGELRPVAGTAFDFNTPKPIGQDIHSPDPQLTMCRGYDHNFCLNTKDALTPAAQVTEPESGRVMTLYTDLPGVQLYCGNFLNGIPGKSGAPLVQHAGFCLETQYYPDTPNRPAFPQCTLLPGETFTSRTAFAFSLAEE